MSTSTTETGLVIPEEVNNQLSTEHIVEAKLKETAIECLSMKLADPNDKVGYVALEEKRKMLKKTRVFLEKSFKSHRDKVNAVIKQNTSAEKYFVGLISPAEAHLEAEAKIYEDEQERVKNEEIARAQKEEEEKRELIRKAEEERQKKIQARQQSLNKVGAVLENGLYTLGKCYCTVEAVEVGHDSAMNDEAFEQMLQSFETEKKSLKESADRIERRKSAILKTGATQDDKFCYVLGECLINIEAIGDMEESDFHETLRQFSVEAEKIKMAKEKERKIKKFQDERFEILKNGGLLSLVREDVAKLGEMSVEDWEKLLADNMEAKKLQDEQELQKKEEQEKRELIVNRKEELGLAGAILSADGAYRLGKVELDGRQLGNFTDAEFLKAIGNFNKEHREITKKAKEELILSRKTILLNLGCVLDGDKIILASAEVGMYSMTKLENDTNESFNDVVKTFTEAKETADIIAKGESREKELMQYGFKGYLEGPVENMKNGLIALGKRSEEEYKGLLEEWKQAQIKKQEEAEKKAEALKPDMQKIKEFAESLKKIKFPICKTAEGKEIIKNAKGRINDQVADILSIVNNLETPQK